MLLLIFMDFNITLSNLLRVCPNPLQISYVSQFRGKMFLYCTIFTFNI